MELWVANELVDRYDCFLSEWYIRTWYGNEPGMGTNLVWNEPGMGMACSSGVVS